MASVFKTPFSSETPKSHKHRNDQLNIPLKRSSDTEDSCASDEVASTGSFDSNLSIVAEYDELIRFNKTIKTEYVYLEKSYAEYVDKSQVFLNMILKSREECLRLQERIDIMARENCDLEGKLALARKLLDREKKNTKAAERVRDELKAQVGKVKKLILSDKELRRAVSNDTLGGIALMELDRIDQEQAPHLSCIPEVNSTGSILSEFSYSRSEDDLDTSSVHGSVWKKHRPSADVAPEQPAMKKRRSSGNKVVEINTTDTVRATTTLTLPKHGPITATSVIEAVPTAPSKSEVFAPSAPPETPQTLESYPEPEIPAKMVFESWARKEGPPKPVRKFGNERRESSDYMSSHSNNCNHKHHTFHKKTVVLPDSCGFCQKKIRFGRLAWKCRDCKNLCHEECKDKLPTPCIPVINTPNQRNGFGTICDYTGTSPPMVPAIIMHCVNEIEFRDSSEIGLYRVSGSEKDVKTLKERFLKGKAAPCLNDVDIHVLCGVVKDFLKSLQEPIVPTAARSDFVKASEKNDVQMLMVRISELPQPNRDTLAYMMLHLQRISEKKEIKMTVDNLAKVFGPTIVGYSTEYLDHGSLMKETVQNITLMTFLIKLPTNYWESYVNVTQSCGTIRLQQTPSTDSLLIRPPKTPSRIGGNTPKRRRFFPTPPNSNN